MGSTLHCYGKVRVVMEKDPDVFADSFLARKVKQLYRVAYVVICRSAGPRSRGLQYKIHTQLGTF